MVYYFQEELKFLIKKGIIEGHQRRIKKIKENKNMSKDIIRNATTVYGSGVPNKELKVNMQKKYGFVSKVSSDYHLNMAYYKIFSDFFNIISQDDELKKSHDIDLLYFIRHKDFCDTLDLPSWWGITNIIFTYKENTFVFVFDKYKEDNHVIHSLLVHSKERLDQKYHDIFQVILDMAILLSDLKGSYIEMLRRKFEWKKRDLEKRSFNDIFLPESLMSDLKMYVNVFGSKNKLLRYLMIGIPGTGKTESILVLSNELNKKGVTIIKTPIDELLKEKVELATLLAPTILLFDDLDLSIGSRTKGGYSPQELQSFLDVMDGTDKIKEDVGIIATTNSSHLLDLAAQRPGRFEKILMFDHLNKKNIGKIILKSLKYNFGLNGNSDITKMFYNKQIVEKFYDSKVTGAYIFNLVNVLKLKSDMEDNETNLNWILKEVDTELNVAEKIKDMGQIKDKYSGKKRTLGFGGSYQTEEEFDDEPFEYEEDFDPEEEDTEISDAPPLGKELIDPSEIRREEHEREDHE